MCVCVCVCVCVYVCMYVCLYTVGTAADEKGGDTSSLRPHTLVA